MFGLVFQSAALSADPVLVWLSLALVGGVYLVSRLPRRVVVAAAIALALAGASAMAMHGPYNPDYCILWGLICW